MYDIVFISYNEPHADTNWELLKTRFPRAQRVAGVRGIVAAHQSAAAICTTRWFWVVDADNVVEDDFDFSFVWPHMNQPSDSVGVWRARNSVNGLVYGYGGIKLLPRRRVLQMDPGVVDFTTSIGKNFTVMPELTSTTVIDASEFDAWKAAFRECAKLSASIIHRQKQSETDERLNTWCTVASGAFSDAVLMGATAGKQFGNANRENPDMLTKLNDFTWLRSQFDATKTPIIPEDLKLANAALLGMELLYPEKPFIRSLRQTMLEYPEAQWCDALSHGQLESKKWLVNTIGSILFGDPESLDPKLRSIDYYFKNIYMCASWYGILGELFLDRFGAWVGQIRGLDIDPHAVMVANRLMKHRADNWQFKTTVKDIYTLNYENDELSYARQDGSMITRTERPTMIINTSCDHIERFSEWWNGLPKGRLLVLQNNNFFEHQDHSNCVVTLDEFAAATPMRTVLYSGALSLQKYTRFMRIGMK